MTAIAHHGFPAQNHPGFRCVKSLESNGSHGSFVHEVKFIGGTGSRDHEGVVRPGRRIEGCYREIRGTALAPGDQADHLKQKQPLNIGIKAMLATSVDILLLFRGADDYFMALS